MIKILRLEAAKETTGLSRSSIYNMMKTGDFPRSILLGERAVGWLESDIQLWINSRVRKQDEGSKLNPLRSAN
jgi:prophage regulatory protein